MIHGWQIGRRVVDGELIAPDPDQLWQETLKRMACFTSCEVKLDGKSSYIVHH